MTEAVIAELGKISSPRVISCQSVMPYKGSKKSMQEIARELNVDAILECACKMTRPSSRHVLQPKVKYKDVLQMHYDAANPAVSSKSIVIPDIS
jgi:hypothetical protein